MQQMKELLLVVLLTIIPKKHMAFFTKFASNNKSIGY